MKFKVFYTQNHIQKSSKPMNKEEVGDYLYSKFKRGACSITVVCLENSEDTVELSYSGLINGLCGTNSKRLDMGISKQLYKETSKEIEDFNMEEVNIELEDCINRNKKNWLAISNVAIEKLSLLNTPEIITDKSEQDKNDELVVLRSTTKEVQDLLSKLLAVGNFLITSYEDISSIKDSELRELKDKLIDLERNPKGKH